MNDPTAASEELQRASSVRPEWTRVVSASEALGLDSHTLLHAGPPFAPGEAPTAPIRNAAALCCVYEGWAQDLASAQRMILDGRVRLRPAQDRGAVTPLAAIISPRSTLVEVRDAGPSGLRCWSLLPSGPGPDLRFGALDPAILERLAYRDVRLAPMIGATLATPVDLNAIASDGLQAQDDLHGSTAGATRALGRTLLARLPADSPEADALRTLFNASPLFFLTLWMAACRLVASAVEGVPDSHWITRVAGNGRRVGITLAGEPGCWITAPAAPPVGPKLPDVDSSVRACGVIGDSAIIDASGFGGSALAHAGPTRQALGDAAPADAGAIAREHLMHPHPHFRRFGIRIGLDATAVSRSGITPLVVIGMIDEAGEKGLLGRGVYRPPLALFEGGARER